MTKSIAFNLLPFTQKLTGTGYYTKRLIAALQRVDKTTPFELHVYNLPDAAEIFDVKNPNFKIKHHKFIKNKLGRIIYEQIILPFFIKTDVFVSPSVVLPVMLPKRIKSIAIIHDLIPFLFKDKYGFIQRWYIKLFTKFSAQKADTVITISRNSRNDIIKILSISEQKIKIVYNFITDKGYENHQKNEKVFHRENFLITVSTIQPGKNLIRLFRAFKPIALKRNIKLVVVGGKGWRYRDIFQEVADLNIEDYVEFTGYVTDEELASYYQRARGLVYVSLYEGFGIPPLEAITHECPVVVSNNSSLPEVVGSAGIYVDPLDITDIERGIEQLFDEHLIEEKIKKMPIEANKFSGEEEARKFMQIVSTLS